MSTSGDRTSRLKFKISERNQPFPCYLPDGRYLLVLSDLTFESFTTDNIIVVEAFMPNSPNGNIAAAAYATVEGISATTTARLDIIYTPSSAPSSPVIISSGDFTLTAGVTSQIAIITDNIPYYAIEPFYFSVRLVVDEPVVFSEGKLLLTS